MSSLSRQTVRIFLTGDVMLGRGVDQVLLHPSNPTLYESYMKDARGYVKIAEKINGVFPSKNITSQNYYIWGDLIKSFNMYSPDVKLINLETSITKSDDYWPSKGINYRMNPQNIYTLNAIKTNKYNNNNNDNDIKQNIDNSTNLVCNLANNHILDWNYNGLNETLSTLRNNDILFCGAGENNKISWKPAVIEVDGCRIFIFGVGSESSGCPIQWNSTNNQSGISIIDPYNTNHDYIQNIKKNITDNILNYKNINNISPDDHDQNDNIRDIIILSIHWGGNWGFDINKYFIKFAHSLIDNISIDLIHGHSSHHIKGFEIYKNKPIFYGCGDFLSDYEGITGDKIHDSFNDDLSFMYFVDLDVNTGNVDDIILKGTKVKHFRVTHAQNDDLKWLQTTIKEQCKKFNLTLYEHSDGTMRLKS